MGLWVRVWGEVMMGGGDPADGCVLSCRHIVMERREAEAVSDGPPSGTRHPSSPPCPNPQQPQRQKLRIEEVLSHCM